MNKQLPIRKIRPKTGFYRKIIEVRVPIRFYWDEGGFDGIEFGPLGKDCTPYCRRLILDILGAIPEFMHQLPKPFLEAFNE